MSDIEHGSLIEPDHLVAVNNDKSQTSSISYEVPYPLVMFLVSLEIVHAFAFRF